MKPFRRFASRVVCALGIALTTSQGLAAPWLHWCGAERDQADGQMAAHRGSHRAAPHAGGTATDNDGRSHCDDCRTHCAGLVGPGVPPATDAVRVQLARLTPPSPLGSSPSGIRSQLRLPFPTAPPLV